MTKGFPNPCARLPQCLFEILDCLFRLQVVVGIGLVGSCCGKHGQDCLNSGPASRYQQSGKLGDCRDSGPKQLFPCSLERVEAGDRRGLGAGFQFLRQLRGQGKKRVVGEIGLPGIETGNDRETLGLLAQPRLPHFEERGLAITPGRIKGQDTRPFDPRHGAGSAPPPNLGAQGGQSQRNLPPIFGGLEVGYALSGLPCRCSRVIDPPRSFLPVRVPRLAVGCGGRYRVLDITQDRRAILRTVRCLVRIRLAARSSFSDVISAATGQVGACPPHCAPSNRDLSPEGWCVGAR